MFLQKFAFILVCLYPHTLNVSCQLKSISAVIDNTRSMLDNFERVQREMNSVVLGSLAQEIEYFVLVTINDSETTLRMKTKSKSEFQKAINSLRVDESSDEDCGEMILTGIEKALLASGPNSLILVFTDGSAKDYYKADTIKHMCRKQQSQVIFVEKGDCRSPSDKTYTVYGEIAAAYTGFI